VYAHSADSSVEDYENVVFGKAPAKPKPEVAAVSAKKGGAASKIKKTMLDSKKAKRTATPVVVQASTEAGEVPESPFVLDTSNPFAALMSPSPVKLASPSPAKKRTPAAKASPPRQGFAATPIARRTRHAARAISQVVSGVIAAVSPALEALTKTKSVTTKAIAKPVAAAAAGRSTRATGLRVVSRADVN